MLNNQDTILIKNAEKKTAEKGSNDLISLKKECIRAKKDYEKKMQQINSVELKMKIDCISFIIEKTSDFSFLNILKTRTQEGVVCLFNQTTPSFKFNTTT